MEIIKIIDQLRQTRSKKTKLKILAAHKDNKDLFNFFRLALNPQINFYQKKDFPLAFDYNQQVSLSRAMELFEDTIASRKITGNAATDFCQNILNNVTPGDGQVLRLILKKDPDCGVDTAAAKIWPELDFEFPCMLASPYTDALAQKLDWNETIIQLKSDGLRVHIIVNLDRSVEVFTRAGNKISVHNIFDFFGQSPQFLGTVIDGELLSIDPATQKFHNRQTSNGIGSKAVHGTLSIEESKNLHIVAWDMIPLSDFWSGESKVPYKTRFENLQSSVSLLVNKIHVSIIPSQKVATLAAAQAFYEEKLSEGEEGAMLKDGLEFWSNTRSKRILKMKSVNTADLEIFGSTEGEGKLRGNLGSLLMASSDRKCLVNMSGFPLKLRSEIWANLQNIPVNYEMVVDGESVTMVAQPGDCSIGMGSILEVKYNQKILERNSDVWSLFLPRFSCHRLDKNVANTLDSIK